MRLRASTVLFATLLSACAVADDEDLSWEMFNLMIYQEPDTGYWVVNGDELVETPDALRAFYDDLIASSGDIVSSQAPLIVNQVKNRDDRWSDAAAQNITYCVSSSSFGSRYSTVVNAMNNATGAWENVANVNFVHLSSEDANCSGQNRNVVFNVRQVAGQAYLARAFFPSSSRRAREVLIDSSSFGNISPWSLTGILRHELGHTLGFRHEHTRPEAGTCFEDNNWRALTAYDSSSVMHYPQCNGTQNGDLVLTNLDKSGAHSLYP